MVWYVCMYELECNGMEWNGMVWYVCMNWNGMECMNEFMYNDTDFKVQGVQTSHEMLVEEWFAPGMFIFRRGTHQWNFGLRSYFLFFSNGYSIYIYNMVYIYVYICTYPH